VLTGQEASIDGPTVFDGFARSRCGGGKHRDQVDQRYRRTGSAVAGQMGGHKPRPIVGAHRDWLIARCRGCAFTLRGTAAELAERGLKVDYRSVCRFVHAEKLSFKKTVLASERDRPDIARRRAQSRALWRDRMLTPTLVEEFVRSFAEELAVRQRDATSRRDRLAQELAATERRLEGVLHAIEDGAWSESLRTRLQDLEHRKSELTAALAEAASPPRVELHPNAAAIYAVKVAELEASLNAPDPRGSGRGAANADRPRGAAPGRRGAGWLGG
jgi:hypothetical protein